MAFMNINLSDMQIFCNAKDSSSGSSAPRNAIVSDSGSRGVLPAEPVDDGSAHHRSIPIIQAQVAANNNPPPR
jgi:hypothetical protein